MATTIISSIFPNIKSCFQLYYSINNNFPCPVIHFFIVNTSTLLIEDMIQYLTFSFTLSICNQDLDSIFISHPFSIVFLLKVLSLFSIGINLNIMAMLWVINELKLVTQGRAKWNVSFANLLQTIFYFKCWAN